MYEFLLECEWLLIQIRFTLILCLRAAWQPCPVLGHRVHAFRSGCVRCKERYTGYAGFAVTFLIWTCFETEKTMRSIPGHDLFLFALLVWFVCALQIRDRRSPRICTAYKQHIRLQKTDVAIARILFLIVATAFIEDKRVMAILAMGMFTIHQRPRHGMGSRARTGHSVTEARITPLPCLHHERQGFSFFDYHHENM